MPKILIAHKGSILTVLAAVAAFLVLAVAGYTSLNSRAPLRLKLTPPTTGEVRLALHRVGLDAEAMAACGMSANQATAVVAAARTQLGDSIADLRGAETSLSDAAKDRDHLAALVRSGRGTADDITALAAAETAVTTARSQFQTLLGTLFTAATAGLTSDQRSVFATVLANRAWREPAKYLTASRSEADWVTLANALANQRVTTRTGESPNPGLAEALAAVNSSSPVTTADAYLQANLATVTAAWNAATQ